jgi:hypothetical protein
MVDFALMLGIAGAVAAPLNWRRSAFRHSTRSAWTTIRG